MMTMTGLSTTRSYQVVARRLASQLRQRHQQGQQRHCWGHQGQETVSVPAGTEEEASQVPSRNRGTERDPEVPEVDGAPHSEAAFPEVGAGDCSESDQGRHPFPERGHHGTAGGLGGLLSGSPSGVQPLRRPRQTGHHHAQGHPAGTSHPKGEELKAASRRHITFWSFSGPPHPPKGVFPQKLS